MRNPAATHPVIAVLLSVTVLFAAAGSQRNVVAHAPQAPTNVPPEQTPTAPPAPVPTSSPDAEPIDVPVFRVGSTVVVLQVNVFDGRSDAVAALPQSAFQVYEDGVEQTIELFHDQSVPVATGLVIDNSSSMITRRAMVSAGVTAFADSSREGDEMFTVVFNEHVRHGLPPAAPFTNLRSLVEASFVRFPPGGMTALHDAVIEGLAHLEQATHPKRVLVVLSDGDDNASRQSQDNMLYRAARSNALIYTIWTGDVSSKRGNPGLLRRLATSNGGVAYAPKSERDVIHAFGTIADNIRRVYSIGYVPTNAARDGSFRRVKVVVNAPGKSLRVRTRDGYTAPDDEHAQ